MNWKNNVLRKSDIYAIIDTKLFPKKSLCKKIPTLLKNKVRLFQIRDKNSDLKSTLSYALELKRLLGGKALLIINDSPEIAILAQADGLHVGQEDIPIKLARKILGNRKIIGASSTSIRQAIEAQKDKADYIGFGSIFETKTKKDHTVINRQEICQLIKKIRVPLFFIGGITPERLQSLKNYRIKKIAVCGALAKSKNIDKTIAQFRDILK